MRLTLNASDLLPTLTAAERYAPRRSTVPILGNVLLTAYAPDGLTLATTGMDQCYRRTVAANVDAPGAVTVNAKVLLATLKGLTGTVTLETLPGDKIRVACGLSVATLAPIPAEDFPRLAQGDLPHAVTLPAADLVALFARVAYAISTEETRYYLCGIHWTGARMVTTDGHQLALVETGLPAPAEAAGVIWPRLSVAALTRTLGAKPKGNVTIAWSDTRLWVTLADGATVGTKLIDGTFPEYERVIPRDNASRLTVDSTALAEAVRRVASVSTERSKPVRFTLSASGLILSASSPEHGERSEPLPAGSTYAGTPLEISFRSRYVQDTCKAAGPGRITFEIGDSFTAVVIRGARDGLHVLMPMRI